MANTAATYFLYLGLRIFIDYRWAFLIAYACGIVFSYFFNAILVFKARPRWATAVSFPAVYVFQYAASTGLLVLLVERFGLDERFAPLVVTAVMVPVTYLLMKILFRATSKEN